MKLYHYTTGHKLGAIQRSGLLLPSSAPVRCPSELGVLWFSAHETWEPTATKPMLHRGVQTRDLQALSDAVGLARFVWSADGKALDELPAAWSLFQWPLIADVARISNAEQRLMAEAGARVGARSADWWGRLAALDISELGLQVRAADGRWVDSTLDDAVAEFRARRVNVLSAVAA